MNRMMTAMINRTKGSKPLPMYPINDTLEKRQQGVTMLDNQTKQEIKLKVEKEIEKMMNSDVTKVDIKIKVTTTEHTDQYTVKLPKPEMHPVLKAMRRKMESLYEENKISRSDFNDIEMLDFRMYQKAYETKQQTQDFDNFLIRDIYQNPSFSEVDKEELRMNEYAQKVLKELFTKY